VSMDLLQVPEQSGEVVCRPPFRTWRALAEENAAHLEGAACALGEPLGRLRAMARAEILVAAAQFSARWGTLTSGPLVVTGHQPVFVHPGIWTRNLLLGLSEGIQGLHLIVDTDEVEVLDVALPRRDGRLGIVRRVLGHYPPGVPFEAAPPPTRPQWEAFMEAVRADITTLGHAELLERVERTAQVGAALCEECGSLGAFMAHLRRSLEPPASYLELPVSRLSQTRAFLHFAAWIARSGERFWRCHNEALDAYRLQAGIRSAAQPFPNLRREGSRYELPLWTVRDGRRQPVFAEPRGECTVLWAPDRVLGEVRLDRPPEELHECALRPRALTLTLFVRLFLVDLFVHGIGGARYDRATDQVIRALFGIEPPAYAVATATFHLPLGDPPDPHVRRTALQQRLMTLLHNPDRVLDPVPESLRPLMEEKWRLIRRLEEDGLTRRERRAMTQRIRALNAELAQPLREEIARVREELDRLAHEEAEYAAATYREYPFFLFDGGALRETLRKAVGSSGG
jgi:hypothetical protein